MFELVIKAYSGYRFNQVTLTVEQVLKKKLHI